eukprot:CAMPEP_0198285238 /NCGR_PEP_ID=MMETSP1449-20131203/4566_1 /TAXON_ID=420275 /ORGANISM="Attheya septentrionalis, Strain CCMP2084" /LENGTH=237 /DNA_ID=CAMNT_0043982583 /DNA_START=110 /DNA_END=823 /DNA_ORIENTATION=-
MQSAQALWDKAAPLIAVTEQHPFLVAMVDGTLDMESFQYYVIQDAWYLKDFADCLRRLGRFQGDEKSENSEDDAARLEAFAVGAEEAELSLHKGFFTEWNICFRGVKPMPHTVLYTSYMMRTVATRCHAEGLAVLLPCFWVYMHVGKCMLQLRKDLGDSVKRSPQFDAWIDMYAGDEFEKEVTDFIAMVDVAAKNADSDTYQKMEEHFLMSCKLEHMFWDQAQNLMKWPEMIKSLPN